MSVFLTALHRGTAARNCFVLLGVNDLLRDGNLKKAPYCPFTRHYNTTNEDQLRLDLRYNSDQPLMIFWKNCFLLKKTPIHLEYPYYKLHFRCLASILILSFRYFTHIENSLSIFQHRISSVFSMIYYAVVMHYFSLLVELAPLAFLYDSSSGDCFGLSFAMKI